MSLVVSRNLTAASRCFSTAFNWEIQFHSVSSLTTLGVAPALAWSTTYLIIIIDHVGSWLGFVKLGDRLLRFLLLNIALRRIKVLYSVRKFKTYVEQHFVVALLILLSIFILFIVYNKRLLTNHSV